MNITATAAGYFMPRKEGGTRLVGTLDVQRWMRECDAPRIVKAVVTAVAGMIADAPRFVGKGAISQIARATGYSPRQVRRGIRTACEMGLLVRTLVPWSVSTFEIVVGRVAELAARGRKLWRMRTESLRTFAGRMLQAAAAGVQTAKGAFLPGVPDVVYAVMTPDTAHRLGWTQARCWSLWARAGHPKITRWQSDWELLAEGGLQDLSVEPDWLWSPKKWAAKVAAMRSHKERGGSRDLTPVRGASELFPPGSQIRVPARLPWASRLSLDRALSLLQRTACACCLPPAAVPVRWDDGGALVVHVGEPEALAVASEAGPSLLDVAPGPFVVTW